VNYDRIEGTLFSDEEMSVLKEVFKFAAAHCGGGEDIMGAIIWNGGHRALSDDKIVRLANKIESAKDIPPAQRKTTT
jgi:hypothetical protein